MAILEKEVWITLNSMNILHYERLAYEIPREKNKQGKITVKRGTKILVKIEDVQKGSGVKLTKICDNCNRSIKNQTINTILNSRKDGKDYCQKCRNKLLGETRKINPPTKKSLEYYAKHNNKLFLLKEFSIKNKRKPIHISQNSNETFIWNCPEYGDAHEYNMRLPNRVVREDGCPYCAKRRVNETNNLWTTHPKVAKLLLNQDIGYNFTSSSGHKVDFKCDKCNNITFNKMIREVVRLGLCCQFCSDGFKYPEKFMTNVLTQSNVLFERQKIFQWSKIKNKTKIYDFYIPSLNCIVEVHGEQHYGRGFGQLGGRSLKEEQKNDKLKERIAKENGIKYYIVIDCRISNKEFIKLNILQSELNNLLNLKNINWQKCHEYACSSLVKKISNLWGKDNFSIKKITEMLNLSSGTVRKYLKQGTDLGWCKYDPNKSMKRQITQLTSEKTYIATWDSVTSAKETLNINATSIIRVCRGKRKTAGGYRWMYKEDYIAEQKENWLLHNK